MEKYFRHALRNITGFGDTDIFPFPVENAIFRDKLEETISLLKDIDVHFKDRIVQTPPANEGALAPVSYTGFRWATQVDPIWNAYFLGVTLSIAEKIEAARISVARNTVFSYRYQWNEEQASIFNETYNWRAFMEHSVKMAESAKFVVVCDISEFYARINHHRLENALKHLNATSDAPSKICTLLSNFSGTYSFGIPVGGPASRILSELVINQIDKLLSAQGISFCRFADDYHLFSPSYEDAFACLVFLSEKLLRNQGLQLQKSKTRIMTSQEFISTSPIKAEEAKPADANTITSTQQTKSAAFMRFSVRFDPYSSTAEDDYASLRRELKKFDIISLLQSELTKSRIHISLSRKIVSAIRFMDKSQIDDAVLSLISNADLLYPIYTNVLITIKYLFDDLGPDCQTAIINSVLQQITQNSHVLGVELNLLYAVRLLSCKHTAESEDALIRLYESTSSILLRRDIILVMAKWKVWYWLSDLRTRFRTLSALERRSLLIGSYTLKDEGDHWRKHITPELTPFEKLIKGWASQKFSERGWVFTL